MSWRLRRARSGTLCILVAALSGSCLFVLPPQPFKESSVPPPASIDSTAASTANLAKNIVGAGVLSLPSGAGKVLDAASGSAVGSHDANVSALLLLYVIFGALNAYGFYLIGEVCERTGARTYQEAWTKTLGSRFAWMPSAASVICSFTGMVACVAVIGDTAMQLLTSMGQDFLHKDMLMGAISSLVLFPLCLLPSLSPLAFASVLGILGVIALAVVMVLRWFDGSYELGGSFYSDAKTTLDLLTKTQAPSQPENLLFQQICIFAAILSNAFSAHFNAPAIFNELEPQADASGRRSRLPQLATVTASAFTMSGVIFWIITMAGFETFGAHADGSILNSYSAADPLVAVARVGLGLCVLFEFPLLERCFRQTAVEVLGLPDWVEKQALTVAASVALSVALAFVPGFGLDKTSALGGALGASLLIYVAPALMALNLGPDKAARGAGAARSMLPKESGAQEVLLRGVAGLGSLLGGFGVAESMQV